MTTIREQVKEFHEAFGVPAPEAPVIPNDERVRLRLKLITEEWTELLAATLDTNGELAAPLLAELFEVFDQATVKVSMSQLADAHGGGLVVELRS